MLSCFSLCSPLPLRRPRRPCMTSSPPSSSGSSPSPSPRIIPGTPCFTRRLSSSPMPASDRSVYFSAASTALRSHLLSSSPSTPVVIQLLPPELDPTSDVYDRRFLLSLVWSLVSSTELRSRILVQSAMSFGAVPLSVAGLRRMIEADINASIPEWQAQGKQIETEIRTGALEDPNDIDEKDEIVFVVSPTNAVSMPVVEDVSKMLKRAAPRPVIIVNPRLQDVPSHSGVMQVTGRAERIDMLRAFRTAFVMRPLYKSGTVYPIRGILHRAYPGPWEVWKAEGSREDEYRRISTFEEEPQSDHITGAFEKDAYEIRRMRKQLMQGDSNLDDIPLVPLIGSAALALLAGLYALNASGNLHLP